MGIYHNAVKYAVYDAYGGRFCACCGEDTLEFLTIDHIDGGGNIHRRSLGPKRPCASTLCYWLRDNGFPPGFQILCMNCNLGRHRNGGVCPHVTHPARREAQRIADEALDRWINEGE